MASLKGQAELDHFIGKVIIASYESYGVQLNRDADELTHNLTHFVASNDSYIDSADQFQHLIVRRALRTA